MQITTRQGTRLTVIPTGRLLADGGAMFGRVPKTLWQNYFAADHDNNISLGTNAVLIERPDSLTLFDAGPGSRYTASERTAFGLPDAAVALPEHVDRLILSHLHYDHCGGVHDLTASEVLVSSSEWTAGLEPDLLSVESIRSCDLAAIKPRLRKLVQPGAIAPGLEVIFTPGHTTGHLSLLVDDEVLCVADLVPTAAHLRLDWLMAYDLDPLTVIAQKRRILDLAVRRSWRLILPHEPEQALVDVRLDGYGFSAQPAK